ncbi:MAG: Trm112 family protein [Gammaproteobacteria bacterium]
MINQKLLEILVCPKTRSSLIQQGDELISKKGKLAYPIRDGIPIMLIKEARELSEEELKKL